MQDWRFMAVIYGAYMITFVIARLTFWMLAKVFNKNKIIGGIFRELHFACIPAFITILAMTAFN